MLGSRDSYRFENRCVLSCTCLWILLLHPVTGQTATSFSTTPLTKQYCRTVYGFRSYYCPLENYEDFTCMVCYWFLPDRFKFPGVLGKYDIVTTHECAYGMRRENSSYYIPPSDIDYKNESSLIYQSITEKGKQFWQDCCEAAKKCCAHMLKTPTKQKPDGPKYCPKTFDGWQCFEETEAGHIHESICEDHIHFVGDPPQCPLTLARKCGDNGTWPGYKNFTKTEWTNYTLCTNMDTLKIRHQIHVASFIVSICSLAPALAIFFSYKQLRVPRITMHKNLFFSLLINGIVLVIFKYEIAIQNLERDVSLSQDSVTSAGNTVGCRFLFALTKYTRTTNYMWMFCEGFYLHKLIVAAFSEQKRLLIYYIFGWGLPVIPVLIYSILRITDSEADVMCWGQHAVAKYEWVVNGPNLLSLVLNLLFLVNIIRVLVTKLKATHSNDPHRQYRKAVRATLVLIPLFGLHFFVTVYVPSNATCFWYEFYYYLLYIMDGLQGFLVALIFCYLNGEVVFLLRRSFRRWRSQRMPEDTRLRRATDTKVSTLTSTSQHSPASDRSSQTIELKTQKLIKNGR